MDRRADCGAVDPEVELMGGAYAPACDSSWTTAVVSAFHLNDRIGGVQFPTDSNECFRGIVFASGQLKMIVRDFSTFRPAYDWHIAEFVSRHVVWC